MSQEAARAAHEYEITVLPTTEALVIDFAPSPEQRIIVDAVASFARARLAGRAREIESLRCVPESVCKGAHEMMLSGVALPEHAGGQGLGMVTAMLVEEEIARVDAAAAFALPGPGALGDALVELGTEAQQREHLASYFAPEAHGRRGAVAWSEPRPNRERPGMSTLAVLQGDGWILNGEKAFVLNAISADQLVVFAQIDEAKGWHGLGAFVVAGDAAGLSRGERYQTLGLDAAELGGIVLADVRVAASARLSARADFTAALLSFFVKRALVVAARAVGLAHRAFELAREYCDTRVAFGKPIGHFQAVAFTLADRLMDLESARWLVWQAAWAWDANKPERERFTASAHAVAHALEVAMRTADDCVSLHGGSGFIRDVLAEKLMRDAKQIALSCLTSSHMDQLAVAASLGAELDPALLLPTPETQAIFT